MSNIKKQATAVNSYDWNVKDLEHLSFKAKEGSRMYEGWSEEIQFRKNKHGDLYLIRTTYSETQIFAQFSGVCGEEAGPVILVVIPEGYKKGDTLQSEWLIELENV